MDRGVVVDAEDVVSVDFVVDLHIAVVADVDGVAALIMDEVVPSSGCGEAAGFSRVLMERPGLMDLPVGLWRSLWAAWSLDALAGRLGLFTFLWA